MTNNEMHHIGASLKDFGKNRFIIYFTKELQW